jgi:hypothetical protein
LQVAEKEESPIVLEMRAMVREFSPKFGTVHCQVDGVREPRVCSLLITRRDVFVDARVDLCLGALSLEIPLRY